MVIGDDVVAGSHAHVNGTRIGDGPLVGRPGIGGGRMTGDVAGFAALRVKRVCYSFRTRVATNRKLSCSTGS